ncbi:MAG TPA: MASE1 domain-containing protein [Pseudolabrys sp.]|nr:MASE1 domain-containing protein [Pseudolabrys sp.]
MKHSDDGEAKGPAFRGALAIVLYALELAAVAAAVFGLAYSNRLLPAINPAETPLWPPTGVALALVLLRGYRIWPAILAGSFLAGAMAARPLADSASIAIATLGAALAGAFLIERWAHGRNAFATPLDVMKFALLCFVPTALIGATIVTAGFFLSGALNTTQPLATGLTWFFGDAAGSVIVAPVILLWAATSLRPFAKSSVLEATAIFAATAVIGMAAFSPLVDSDLGALLPYRSLLGVLVLLPLTWTALRGNQRNAATAALIFCGMAVWGFSEGSSPFAKADLNGARLLLFVILVSASVAPLVVATAVAVRRNTETHLLSVQEQLNRKIAETNKALDSAKRHFQILIEGVVDYAIFVLDTAGRVASWNSAAQQIIGYTAEEIIGKHFGIFYRPDERRAGEPNRALEMAVQKDKHEVEGWRIRKNGTLVFVTGSVSVIRDDSGNLIGFANVIRDATERRDAQEKLVEAREQLAMAQKMEAIGKLTGGIAHDFNNLLMIIGGNAQMFKRLLDPKLPRAIEAIQTAAKRGESLTRQLLTFSRRQHLSPTVVDLGTCIRNMRPMIESSLRGNIVYNEKIAAEVAPVKVDQAELELAIVNIAVNARDAMPTGGTFTLSISNVTEAKDPSLDQLVGSFVALGFGDSGMGIPPNLLTKIFDPFFTTKEVGKGTGLGLSQVYGFAHQAGGTVRAESKIGQGTTITVYLPASPAGEIAVKDTAVRDSTQSLRPTVLVVDDSAEVAQVTSSLFEHLGFNTVYRDSAEGALKLLAEGTKLDLVFSDIVMPGTIDGVGLASEIRSHYPEIPVVLTTGYSDAAQSVPPDLPILRKPFDTDALRGFIQDTVDLRPNA